MARRLPEGFIFKIALKYLKLKTLEYTHGFNNSKRNYKIHTFLLTAVIIISYFIFEYDKIPLLIRVTVITVLGFLYLLKCGKLNISSLGLIYSRVGIKKYIHKDDILSLEFKQNIGLSYLEVKLNNGKSHKFSAGLLRKKLFAVFHKNTLNRNNLKNQA